MCAVGKYPVVQQLGFHAEAIGQYAFRDCADIDGRAQVASLKQGSIADARPVGDHTTATHGAADEKGHASRAVIGSFRAVEPCGPTEFGDEQDGAILPDGVQALAQIGQALVQADRGETVKTETVRDMLGLADRSQTIALFEQIMAGRTPEALELFRTLYGYGADPVQVTNDLLEHCHAASVAKMLGPQATRLPNDQAQKLTETTPKMVVMLITEAARLWPERKRVAMIQALMPVGTEDVSTIAAVQGFDRPSRWAQPVTISAW